MDEYRKSIKETWMLAVKGNLGLAVAKNVCQLIDTISDHQFSVLCKRWQRHCKGMINPTAAMVAMQFADDVANGKIPVTKPIKKEKTEAQKKAEADRLNAKIIKCLNDPKWRAEKAEQYGINLKENN